MSRWRWELDGRKTSEWGMVLGAERDVLEGLALGAEFQIPAAAPGAAVIPGFYWERGGAILKAGVALPLSTDSAGLELLSAVSVQF